MKKHCIECSAPFVGRSDKKFCSNDCRSRHYHKTEGKNLSKIRGINYILKRNRAILSKYTQLGRRRVNRSQLLELGFSFEYFTHFKKTRSGRNFKFCYDQGYFTRDDDRIDIKSDT